MELACFCARAMITDRVLVWVVVKEEEERRKKAEQAATKAFYKETDSRREEIRREAGLDAK